MAWVFNKTLWVQDNPPYITAAQMNRIETGIAGVTPKNLDLDGVGVGVFNGLDGATDKAYVLEGTGFINSALTLIPNAAVANTFRTQSHQVFRAEDNVLVHSVVEFGGADAWTISTSDWGLSGTFSVHAIITARRVGASPKMLCTSRSIFSPHGDGIVWPLHRIIERDNIGIRYDAAAPPLTTLTVSAGAGVFTDTRFSLRPLGR